MPFAWIQNWRADGNWKDNWIRQKIHGTNNTGRKRNDKVSCYHNPNEKPPGHLHDYFESAYQKWYSVFYNNSDPLFGKISPVLLGKEIEYLRVTNQYNKSELASMVGIDRTTLFDIEQGLRLPSTETLHRICVILKFLWIILWRRPSLEIFMIFQLKRR